MKLRFDVRERPPLLPETERAGGRFAAWLENRARFLEGHSVVPICGLVVVYVLAVLSSSRAKLLWHDELFTLYISGAPSLAEMFREIRTIDLNPPLSYLLTRLSMQVFGRNTLACRLPEMLAFLVAMLALAAFVRNRAGTLYGVLAAGLLFSSLAGELAVEARPYGLLLAFTAIGLLAWQKAGQSEGVLHQRTQRLFGFGLLALGASGLLLSHVFGLLPWAVLLLAEGTRSIRRRRVDWMAVLMWVTPLLCCITYAPMLRNHGASAFPPAFQPTPEDVFLFYISHIDRELITLGLTALALLLLLGRSSLRGDGSWRLGRSAWMATIGLLLLPGVLIAYLMHAHAAFFPRYGVVACLGVAIVTAVLLSRWASGDLRAPLLATVISLLISGQIASAAEGLVHIDFRHPFRSTEPAIPACAVCARIDAIDASLPLVDASGLTFLEMDHRESTQELRRVFYLTDGYAAMGYAHATIFEGMGTETRIFPMRAQVRSYETFLREHPRFFVLGTYNYPEDWLLRKLSSDGAMLRVLGRVAGPYKDHELYEVDVRPTRRVTSQAEAAR